MEGKLNGYFTKIKQEMKTSLSKAKLEPKHFCRSNEEFQK
jgi:hypothetical protein